MQQWKFPYMCNSSLKYLKGHNMSSLPDCRQAWIEYIYCFFAIILFGLDIFSDV